VPDERAADRCGVVEHEDREGRECDGEVRVLV
jgi:hypothetical protein